MFGKRATNYRALLRKMNGKDNASCVFATLYVERYTSMTLDTSTYVFFCKRATNYRALLRKMTCKDKASYGSSPPYM